MPLDFTSTGPQLRDNRRALGFSIRSLAEGLGMSKNTILAYENSDAALPVWFVRAYRDLARETPAEADSVIED